MAGPDQVHRPGAGRIETHATLDSPAQPEGNQRDLFWTPTFDRRNKSENSPLVSTCTPVMAQVQPQRGAFRNCWRRGSERRRRRIAPHLADRPAAPVTATRVLGCGPSAVAITRNTRVFSMWPQNPSCIVINVITTGVDLQGSVEPFFLSSKRPHIYSSSSSYLLS